MVYLCWIEKGSLSGQESFFHFINHRSINECPHWVILKSDVIIEVKDDEYPKEIQLHETYSVNGITAKDRLNPPGHYVEVTFHVEADANGDANPKLHYVRELHDDTFDPL